MTFFIKVILSWHKLPESFTPMNSTSHSAGELLLTFIRNSNLTLPGLYFYVPRRTCFTRHPSQNAWPNTPNEPFLQPKHQDMVHTTSIRSILQVSLWLLLQEMLTSSKPKIE